jgi:amino acid permease
MSVSSLDKVLGYVGSTGSTSISFILPGLFYYKISAPDSPHHQRLAKEDDDDYERVNQDDSVLSGVLPISRNRWREALLRNLALALAVYGMIVMAVCLVITTVINVKH